MSNEMPKAYEPKNYEDEIYKIWEESGHFQPQSKEGAKSYAIVLPPPNVTGTLHMGHAGMLAYEDVLIRYHRMKGDRTLWLPGTDHAAIATQTKVEKIIKEEGTSRHGMGREKFLERVRAYALESHDTIVNQCRKMGASLDWTREAYTLDETRNKAVNSVFKLMYDDGLIVRGERIVNWCPRCKSTLADDEVEHREQKANLYFFRYDKNFPITIATTRPETKLGDTAVAVNPKDERYKEYIGKEYEVNFVGVKLKIKIIADRHIEMDFGTGALGVTPAHSQVDWQMAEENNLEIKKVINEDGIIHQGYGEFSSIDAYKARKAVVEKLEAQGLIEKIEEIDNNLSICYRCDTPIEPLPSLQWFISVDKKVERLGGRSIKETCLDAVKKGVFGRDKIKIVPERFEKNYFHWMENLRDWCISRQILFGHQVPVWYRSKIKDRKIGNWKLEIGNLETYVGVEEPAGEDWVQDEDTLDTWFSSGMWTFSTLANTSDQIKIENGKLVIDSEDFRNFHPTQVLETGYDILFFWVARMIVMTTYALNDIPFQDVYLHGLVLDDKGKKMSKSKGNVIDPLDMIEKYGTDATRLSLIVGSSPGNDMRLSEEKIAGFRNLINKIWNVSRFVIQGTQKQIVIPEARSATRNPVEINRQNLTSPDIAVLHEMQSLIKEVTEDLENYRFSHAGEILREFTWNFFADWYLEATKFDNSTEKEAVLKLVLIDLLKLWHPFIPFITEVIWREINQGKQLIVSEWTEIKDYSILLEAYTTEELTQFIQTKDVIIAIRNARAENRIEPSKKVKAVVYAGSKIDLIKNNEALIKGMRTGIDEIEIREAGEEIEGEIKVVVGEIVIYLIGAIDKEKELERIKKRKEELEKLIKGVKSKLDNISFVERAPRKVIESEKKRLEAYQKELEEIN